MDYEDYSEDQLYTEISRRKLAHGVWPWSFPDTKARVARLREILQENDRFRNGKPI